MDRQLSCAYTAYRLDTSIPEVVHHYTLRHGHAPKLIVIPMSINVKDTTYNIVKAPNVCVILATHETDVYQPPSVGLVG